MQEGTIDILGEKKGSVRILCFKGRLDALTSPEVERKVFEIIEGGEHKVLLNFEEVEYISSAGMRMLLSTAKKLKTFSGKLVLCNINGAVLDVLKLSGFDHVLDHAKTEEDALRQF